MPHPVRIAVATLAAGLCAAGPTLAGTNAVVLNAQGGGTPDYAHAKPEIMPTGPIADQPPTNAPPVKFPGAPVVHPGKAGTGVTHPVRLAPVKPPAPPAANSGRTTLAYGFANLPFNTARVSVMDTPLAQLYPYSAAGKLFFNDANGEPSICSASLIGPGLVLTAAHCVAAYGKALFTNVHYVPAYHDGMAPFGSWSAGSIVLPDGYLSGKGDCNEHGVVCRIDIALITLLPSASGELPGPATGTLSFELDGAGFVNGKVLVTQLGYPGNLDEGERMERNDAQGHIDATEDQNTIIGSLMGGGSSGGPWITNFGESPFNSTTPALSSSRNLVVGVTSYGEHSSLPKYLGASPFRSDNLGVLYSRACAASPTSCN